MRRLQHIAVNVIVWATSASVLLAATPFPACRCADGHVKLFCFSSASAKSSCCCGGTCCPSEKDQDCCHKGKRDPAADKTSEQGPALAKACCAKTLVHVKGSTLNRSETQIDQNAIAMICLTAESATEMIVSPPAQLLAMWRLHQLPPPTDLVTALQRLTI